MDKPYQVAIVGVLGACLCCVTPVAGATLNNQTPIFDSEIYDLPPADLAGWFLTFDPSTQWTSTSNIATMESWLAIVAQITANPQALNQFYARRFSGIGLTDSPPPALWQWLGSGQFPQAPQQDFVPEPATLELLGASLVTLGFYIPMRTRRRNTKSTHVSLRRTD